MYICKNRKLDIHMSRYELDDWCNFWFVDVDDKINYHSKDRH